MTSNLLNNSFKRNNNRQNIYASILIIITILILFFITSDLYSSYIQVQEEKTLTDSKLSFLKAELNSMNDKKMKVKNDWNVSKLISQFASQYREDVILNQLYKKFDWTSVDSISMDKWQKLPNWLSMADILITVSAKNVTELKKYLDYLTWDDSEIRFVIKSISFPFNSFDTNSPTQASISLWMYYYQNK